MTYQPITKAYVDRRIAKLKEKLMREIDAIKGRLDHVQNRPKKQVGRREWNGRNV